MTSLLTIIVVRMRYDNYATAIKLAHPPQNYLLAASRRAHSQIMNYGIKVQTHWTQKIMPDELFATTLW